MEIIFVSTILIVIAIIVFSNIIINKIKSIETKIFNINNYFISLINHINDTTNNTDYNVDNIMEHIELIIAKISSLNDLVSKMKNSSSNKRKRKRKPKTAKINDSNDKVPIA